MLTSMFCTRISDFVARALYRKANPKPVHTPLLGSRKGLGRTDPVDENEVGVLIRSRTPAKLETVKKHLVFVNFLPEMENFETLQLLIIDLLQKTNLSAYSHTGNGAQRASIGNRQKDCFFRTPFT